MINQQGYSIIFLNSIGIHVKFRDDLYLIINSTNSFIFSTKYIQSVSSDWAAILIEKIYRERLNLARFNKTASEFCRSATVRLQSAHFSTCTLKPHRCSVRSCIQPMHKSPCHTTIELVKPCETFLCNFFFFDFQSSNRVTRYTTCTSQNLVEQLFPRSTNVSANCLTNHYGHADNGSIYRANNKMQTV